MNTLEKEIYLRIYEENKERLYWMIVKRCNWLEQDEISDIMQETWEALGVNIQKVSEWEKSAQWSWLVMVAYNQAVNVVRNRVKRQELAEKIKAFEGVSREKNFHGRKSNRKGYGTAYS